MFHVLIVDDEKVLQRNLTRALQRSGFGATGVSSVLEARRVLAERGADLMCLDVRLSDGDGLEFLSEVRATHSDLPVVVMTGQETDGNRERAELLDVAAYLVKPFSLDRIREIVRFLSGREGPSEALTAPATLPEARKRPYSVLMYSHDSIGMGHVRRNSNIAKALVRDAVDVNVLMLVGCPAGVIFDLPPGVDFVKLPSVVKVEQESWQSRRLRITAEETRELRAELIDRATRLFKPDLVLVDHVPAGVWNELLPTLAAMKSSPNPPRIVLGLRDILDHPERLRRSWRENGTYDIIGRYYDEVLIYGSERIFACGQEYGLEAVLPDRVHYCGYLSSEDNVAPVAETRAELAVESSKLILVTAGGGHDAYPLAAASLKAFERVDAGEGVRMIVVTGPLMETAQRAELERQAKGTFARVLNCVNGLTDYLAAADLVVTMAGYNTLVESIRLGKSIIVVPRPGPSGEQRSRTRLFHDLGLVRGLDPDELSPARLAAMMAVGLASPPKARISLGLNGVDEATRHLNRLLGRGCCAPARPAPAAAAAAGLCGAVGRRAR